MKSFLKSGEHSGINFADNGSITQFSITFQPLGGQIWENEAPNTIIYEGSPNKCIYWVFMFFSN